MPREKRRNIFIEFGYGIMRSISLAALVAVTATGCNSPTEQSQADSAQADSAQADSAQADSAQTKDETAALPAATQAETDPPEAAQAPIAREEPASDSSASIPVKAENTVRIATYNCHMFRKKEGELAAEMQNGDSKQAQKIAEVIQLTRPDVLLLNEFDYDNGNTGIQGFLKNYLAVSQNGNEPIEYPFIYAGPVNTGVGTGMDFDGDGSEGSPNDAFGFGFFPGQYGMAVLSKLEIDTGNVRTFQKFLWKDMPEALWPIVPETEQPFYSGESKAIFRLSSKSHWDVPIKVGDKVVHFLASHPTPPVFDQEEDRNGCRNHDEIRMFADYVSGNADYLFDDKFATGGLPVDSYFVIAGDLNADPVDGDSRDNAAQLVTEHPDIQAEPVPVSAGGKYHATGAANEKQSGDPAADTGVFGSVGNMRVDYCLPSKSLTMTANGVFWPVPGQVGAEAVEASDHRMVWIDIEQ